MEEEMKRISIYVFMAVIIFSAIAWSETKPAEKKSLLTSEVLSGLGFRNVGPGLMSGRISDIAIHPKNRSLWYVAVGSGGVWKTENAGTTWAPIFAGQASYSIGWPTLEPTSA